MRMVDWVYPLRSDGPASARHLQEEGKMMAQYLTQVYTGQRCKHATQSLAIFSFVSSIFLFTFFTFTARLMPALLI